MPPPKDKPPNRGEVIDDTIAGLVLLGAFLWRAQENATPCDWTMERWTRLRKLLGPREFAVIVLWTVRGWKLTEIARWLGVSREMVRIIKERAIAKLRDEAEELVK